jgi:hypothetical protein
LPFSIPLADFAPKSCTSPETRQDSRRIRRIFRSNPFFFVSYTIVIGWGRVMVMQGIWAGFTDLLSTLVVLPFIPFVLIWMIALVRFKERKRAIRTAMDGTTALLIISVAVMYNNIFSSSFGFFWILLYFLLGAGLLGNLQKRIRGKLNPTKILRSLWRIGFVIMSLLYILFLIVGITQQLFA